MKKVNVILGILLLALLIVGAYYFWGTNLKADVSAAREENGVRCDVVLSNGEKLQISRLRKKEFMEELARSMGNEFVL